MSDPTRYPPPVAWYQLGAFEVAGSGAPKRAGSAFFSPVGLLRARAGALFRRCNSYL